MDFEWDERKARGNGRKHGIDFADATAVFFDGTALTITDDNPEEERFVTMGSDTLGRILIVVYVWRQDRIRVISARKATGRERAYYRG